MSIDPIELESPEITVKINRTKHWCVPLRNLMTTLSLSKKKTFIKNRKNKVKIDLNRSSWTNSGSMFFYLV